MDKQINYCRQNQEYDKFLSNTNEEKGIDTRQNMKELSRDINYGKETIRLVLQFPDKEQNSNLIQKEVKAVLIDELQEQIKKYERGCCI